MWNTVRQARRRLSSAMFALVAATTLVACDGDQTIDDYLARAETHRTAGRYEASVAELKTALNRFSDDATARTLLGQVYLDIGNGSGATKELQRARQLGATDETVRARLVEAWLLQQDYDRIMAELPPGSNLTGPLLVLRGRALARLGRSDEAIEDYRTAVAIEADADAYLGLILLALGQDDVAKADRFLAEGLAENPDAIGLLILEGERLLRRRHYHEAEAPLARIIERDHRHFGARINLAAAVLGQLRPEDAKVILDALLSAAPGHGMATHLRAVASFQTADYGAALHGATSVLGRGNATPLALLVAGAAHLALDNSVEGERLIAQYFEVMQDAPAQRNNGPLTLALGRTPAAYERLRADRDLTTNATPLLVLLGSAAITNGDLEIGLALLERAAIPPSSQVSLATRVHTIAAQIDSGQLTDAIAGSSQLQSLYPDRASGYFLEGLARARNNEDMSAIERLQTAWTLRPGHLGAGRTLAEIAARGGDLDAAEAHLQATLAAHPENIPTLLELADLARQRGRLDDWEQRLLRAVRTNLAAPEPRLLLARHYLAAGDTTGAMAMASGGLNRSPEHFALLRMVARIQIANGWVAQAAQTYGRLANMHPADAQIRFDLAEVLTSLGDVEGTIQELQAVLALDATHQPARLALARAVLNAGDAERARSEIAALREAMPDSPEVATIEGALYRAEGDHAAAIAAYRKALKLAPGETRAIMLAEAQWAGAARAAAVATLDAWLTRHPGAVEARYRRAQYGLTLHGPAAATAELRRILELDPAHVPAHNDLAWQLFLAGDLEAATAHAEQAHQLAPRLPEIMGTLGVILLTNGDTSRAHNLLHQAADQHPMNGQVNYHYARALIRSGDIQEARRVLQRLLADDRDFADRAAATELLRDIDG